VHRRYYLFTVNLLNTGPDLVQAGPCSEKNVWALHLGRHHRVTPIYFLLKKTDDLFLVITVAFIHFTQVLPIIFRHVAMLQKIYRSSCVAPFLWGHLFGRTCLNPPLVELEYAPDM